MWGRGGTLLSYHTTTNTSDQSSSSENLLFRNLSLKLKLSDSTFSSNKQAEAICDVVTCLDRDCAVGEVSQRLLGSEIVQYLRDSIPR